ncbi:hypothetical protein [uncultured Desulfosarcina sp.]|uniref:hypothetical protein n=1 Tax=uncultured Desulfosarcina sp. TaxID=218289 RepID=UPI0029C85011|nr:hypothetical protein [uncultured Desulfosarcina sp.]
MKKSIIGEPVSKRLSSVKIKAGDHFIRRRSRAALRIEMRAQRRYWPKWGVLKLALGIIAFSAAELMLALNPDGCDAQSQADPGRLSDLAVAQIALMPFLEGQLEPPDAPIDKPLSQSFTQLVLDSRELPKDADQVMTRIVNAALRLRVEERLIPPGRVADAYRTLLNDLSLDTPRKRAVRLGETVDAEVVMVGTVWQYREKGALIDMPDSAASVGFALYLIDVKTGVRFWRGAFNETQQALTDDVVDGIKQLGMGLRWLSAEELARYGVKSVLQNLPLN